MSVLIPKMAARKRMLTGSVVYQTAAAPHLLAPIPRAVIVPVGADPVFVRKRQKAEIAAARKEEERR